MSNFSGLLRIEPARTSEHLLFNLYNFVFFRRSERGEAVMFGNSRLLAVLVAVPYILGCELAFFRQQRFFVRLKKHVAGIFVLREKPDALYVGSLAVAPEYRRCGVASYILGYCDGLARRFEKSWLELTVLKKNISARLLYEKMGFAKKDNRRQSFVLRKSTLGQKS